MKKDKMLHLIVGIVIAIVILFLIESVAAALLTVIFIGGVKEIWDNKGNGTPELADFLYTFAGGIVGVVLWNTISHLI